MDSMRRDARSALRHARRQLLERGELPPGFAGEPVGRSWQRCFRAGLEPVGRLPEVPHLSAAQLARVAEQQCDLIAHARPVMEYLYARLRHSGSMVILADDRGVLLNALGDADFLTRAERVALMPGASWAERHRGTNAVGTALAEGGAVTVHGAEHYLERNGFLTCAAAPVVAANGRLLGVLDVSGDHRGRHPHTFGLVQTAAQMIENRIFDTCRGASLRLRFHQLAEGIGTVAEGMLALSEDGWIVGANRMGLDLLGITSVDLGVLPISRLFDVDLTSLLDWGRRPQAQPMLVNGIGDRRFFVRVELARQTVAALPVRPRSQDALAAMDAGDAQLKVIIERVRRLLGKQIPLLLQGESGVGKDIFARAAHDAGPRRARPFVAVSCATLPESMIEAELFGYASGAYADARRDGTPGRIREADGGTLFLDEIGDMPQAAQCRLLRVLQERQVIALGGHPMAVDFALICATHRDLKADVEAGRFRADLFYRINGLTLTLPPLRERSDLQPLIVRMIESIAPGRGIALEPAVAAAFADYAWPGNQRQLENVLRTACALLDDDEVRIGWQHLSDDLVMELRVRPLPLSESAPMPVQDLRSLSATAVRQAMAAAHGNISEAARRLGISRNTLYRQLKRLSG